MPYVEIYKLQNNGDQTIIATCQLIDNVAVCSGEEIFVNNLNQEGIYDYDSRPKQKIFPKDGRKFLENLKYSFKSGYLSATDILDK